MVHRAGPHPKEIDNFASAATDGKLWEFEHQLTDISKKVERLFLEALALFWWRASSPPRRVFYYAFVCEPGQNRVWGRMVLLLSEAP